MNFKSLFLVLLCLARVANSDEATVQRFEQEAPPAWNKALGAYARAEGEVRDVLFFQDGFTEEEQESLGHSGIHEIWTSGKKVGHLLRFESGTEVVTIAGDGDGFRLSRDGPQKPWKPDYIGDAEEHVARLEIASHVHKSPLHLFCQTLPWTVSKGGFELVDAEELDDGRVEITFINSVYLRDSDRLKGGTAILDPAKSWCIDSYIVNVMRDEPMEVSGVIVYSPTVDGVAFPKSYTQDMRFTLDGTNFKKQRNYTFTNYAPADVSDKRFTMPFFGLPEIRRGSDGSPLSVVTALVALGVTLICIGWKLSK